MENLIQYTPILLAIVGLIVMYIQSVWVRKQSAGTEKMESISKSIKEGALAFLNAEYRLLLVFVVIASGALYGISTMVETTSWLIVPAFVVLLFSDFPFSNFTSNPLIIESIVYIVILALFGTAIAKVLYIKLLAISSPVFSVSTTYLMPVVAIFWGLLDGEDFKLTQFIGTSIILVGVYLVTKKRVPLQTLLPLFTRVILFITYVARITLRKPLNKWL